MFAIKIITFFSLPNFFPHLINTLFRSLWRVHKKWIFPCPPQRNLSCYVKVTKSFSFDWFYCLCIVVFQKVSIFPLSLYIFLYCACLTRDAPQSILLGWITLGAFLRSFGVVFFRLLALFPCCQHLLRAPDFRLKNKIYASSCFVFAQASPARVWVFVCAWIR